MEIVILIGIALFILGSGYAIGMTHSNSEAYKQGYIKAINDLYNKSVPEYILEAQANREVLWVKNQEEKLMKICKKEIK